MGLPSHTEVLCNVNMYNVNVTINHSLEQPSYHIIEKYSPSIYNVYILLKVIGLKKYCICLYCILCIVQGEIIVKSRHLCMWKQAL